MNKEQIDLVLPWVDGGDLIWQAEKNKYDKTKTVSNVRYQSWDNLQYLFRGIEKYISWVDKIFSLLGDIYQNG